MGLVYLWLNLINIKSSDEIAKSHGDVRIKLGLLMFCNYASPCYLPIAIPSEI